MGSLAEKAVENHKNFYSCSAAVLCAYAEKAGLTSEEARNVAAPFAGGKMGKCGAVMAAEYVLQQVKNADVGATVDDPENACFMSSHKKGSPRSPQFGGCTLKSSER